MKKMLLSFILLSIFCVATYAKSEAQPLDQIAAIVNDDVITQTELKHAISIIKIQMFQEKTTIPSENILKKQVLTQLINKKLQLQLAKQAGLETSEAEVNKAVARIAQQNNMTVKDLYQRISQEGMAPADYRKEMGDQMTMRRLQQQEIVTRMHVSPEEIKSFMNSNIWQDKSTQEYRLEDLLIPLPDGPSPQQIAAAKNKAETLAAKYTKDQSLGTYVKAALGSKAKEVQTGDLGWRKVDEIPSIFAEQVTRMRAKEIIGPIYAPNGFHIVRLADIRANTPQKNQLNKKQVENLLLQRKFELGVQHWISKLRGTAFIVTNV